MNSKALMPTLFLVIAGVVGGCGQETGQTKVENCSNGIDDDGNGLTDCDDSVCRGIASCVEAVKECITQADCITKDGKAYADYRVPSDPMPACVNNKCVKPETGQVDVNFQVKTNPNYSGCCTSQGINAVNSRFVSTTALDGSTVTCDRLQQIAGAIDAPPTAIEDSKLFNLVAYNMYKAPGYPGGYDFFLGNFHLTTGSDFLVWAELWSNRNSTTGLPSGARYGWGCLAGENAATPSDQGTRTITIVMPSPQNPLP